MILSIPFLASRIEQFNPAFVEQGFGIEASLFDRRDLVDADTWATTCRNVRRLAKEACAPSFTFHFPVNDCDYLADSLIRDRLWEALDLTASCGLDGMVLHSNRIFPTDDWRRRDLAGERARYAEFVAGLRERVRGAEFWIGLENMPITGNDACELDPLLVFPGDFDGLCGGNVGITWDFCHYSYSVHVASCLRDGRLAEREDYPNVTEDGFFAFERLAPHIVHYHFSAFSGVASRVTGSMCTEGVPPWEASVEEAVYREAFARMLRTGRAKAATLEIRERDYTKREVAQRVAAWCRSISPLTAVAS
jgi:hypothetical protein